MRFMQVDATISSLAPGGYGVAHVEFGGERRAIFIPYTVPGDRGRIEIDPSRRPARGRILALSSGGPDRVIAPCRWSTRCGGCDWMHLSLDAQVGAHVEHVRAALPLAWRHVSIASVRAPAALAYRTRARLHLKSDRRGHVRVGMHEARTHDPIEVDECVVLDPALEPARRALSPLFLGARGRGEVCLALGFDRRPVVTATWEGDLPHAVFGRLERAVADRTLGGAEVIWGDTRRPARIGDPTPWTTAADGAPLQLEPGGFAQACEPINVALATHVAALASERQVERTVELYAGTGNFSVLLARETKELVCVEASRGAVEAARANLAARGLASARVVEGDAEAYRWSGDVKLVLLDPPRSGARAVAERLAASKVANVVYVSCDPQTLGRDLAVLEKAYAPTSVTAFEMFPQTSHVEVAVGLQRRRS